LLRAATLAQSGDAIQCACYGEPLRPSLLASLALAGCLDYGALSASRDASAAPDLATRDQGLADQDALAGPDLAGAAIADLSTVEGAPPPPKRVFVSSALYNGNLGGYQGADGKCQGLADAVPLGGVYKAWISGPGAGESVAERFTHPGGPYLRTDGTRVADSFAALTTLDAQYHLLATISRTESNQAPPTPIWSLSPGGLAVWSNTQANGARLGDSCNQFSTGALGSGGTAGDATRLS
jgi:hypothetical protein